jgi:predicted O-linked N-acetylglucosamine transferase (SPINDLY family)
VLEAATERHRAGDLAGARRLYRQLLSASPTHAVAAFRAGLLELQDGHPEAALTLVSQAAATDLAEPRYQMGLGSVLQALHRYAEAAAAYRRVLQADPHSPDAHFALGVSLHSLRGHGSLAAAAYTQALALRPDHTDAMSNLGTLLQEMGRLEEAVALLQAAVDRQPSRASYAVNLGIALCRQRKFDAAEAVLCGVLEWNVDHAEAAFNLGIARHGLGKLRQAAEHYRHALELRPGYADALNNLGNVYKELGEFQWAKSAYESALRAQPEGIAALNNLGCLLRSGGLLEDAEAVLRRGLQLHPDHPALLDNLGSVLKDAGELDQAIDCFRHAVRVDPDNAATHSNLVYALSFQSTQAGPLLEAACRWNERFAAPLRPATPSHPNDRSPDRRLRIGYVSPDFREHCQTLFTIPLLSHHDHAQLDIHCYSSVERADDFTRCISGYADVWRDVRRLDDESLACAIRADRIDILVDLTMHMAKGRPLLFARTPAPIQIAWLAYPGTTGMGAMDYRFTDPRLDPGGCDDHYSERSIRLDDSFWCYDPLTDQPLVNPLPAIGRGFVTFGCLNNPCKVTDATLRLWGGVMRAVADSRLRLLAPPGPYRTRFLERLALHGIAADRVSFVPYQIRADYLCAYHEIDIGLDTFPYNGHTTSLDSLWMGVPTISRMGETCVGRGGSSQLFHVDLSELTAGTDAEFIAAAVALAGDLPRLAELRQHLRARLERSPLMDADRFARSIEAAYRKVWKDYCGASAMLGGDVDLGAGGL